jgi:signal transduction histidine kinase
MSSQPQSLEGDDAAAADDGGWERRSRSRTPSPRWIGWRLRGLVIAALIGCVAMFVLLRVMSSQPALGVQLVVDESAALRIAGSPPQPALRALIAADGTRAPLDALLEHRTSRWLASDQDRARHREQHDQLAAALANGTVRFVDERGSTLSAEVAPRGAAGMGWMFWLLATLALLLYLIAMVVPFSRPEPRNLLFALMALAQAGNLVFIAVLSTPSLGWPPGFMRWEQMLRTVFDLVTAAALVHGTNLHPRRLPGGTWRSALAWVVAATVALFAAQDWVAQTWWLTQAAMLVGAGTAIGQLAWAQRHQPHPLALQLLRFCALAAGTLLLLSITVAMLGPLIGATGQVAEFGSTMWVVFLSAMLMMLPFMARTQHLMREFSLLAGVSTVATSLDLLFVAAFSLSTFASLTLALFASLAVYLGLRQWLLSRMMSRERLTTERMFEHVYRIAREVQMQPQRVGDHLSRMLHELFEPLNVQVVARRTQHAHVVAEGVSLVVPIPDITGPTQTAHSAVVLGFADRGRRLFNDDDARLANRIVELIAHAVAFDQAVERGRSEERERIAQDLHDDIGARLLTLMYQAPTPAMEDYLRHTLKDLKTLTRGLAAPSHPLSHAVAEWKADLQQRVAAADCELAWVFAFDDDFELSVVQWSALTRVLRELVSNALAHARATRIEVQAGIVDGRLALSVIDDGLGRRPESWAHGLGLGGVRKRVKQLGGHVEWREHGERGIECRVSVPGFAPP